MIKLIDLSYYCYEEPDTASDMPFSLINALGYIDHLRRWEVKIDIIKHSKKQYSQLSNGILFFNSKKKFWYIPFKTLIYINKEKPDIVLVQGLIFPLQVIFLRLFLPGKCKIIVQHHGESPFRGVKKIFQVLADKIIDAYLFTSNGNAEIWLKEGVINNINKCHEVLEASTYFEKQNKKICRHNLGIPDMDIFLWVGRLEKNKDPITVLRGFEKFISICTNAKLYMIFQDDILLNEIKNIIDDNETLKKCVVLVGKVAYEVLPYWFSSADFFLSGSHKEAAGYALIESMACGCIPVVTNIPPFRKITAGGTLGFLYEPGDPDSLFNACKQLKAVQREEMSEKICRHFQNRLSYKAIANDLLRICEEAFNINL